MSSAPQSPRPICPGSSPQSGRVLIAVAILALAQGVNAQDTRDAETAGTIRFEGYQGAPAISIVPRKGELTFYPCEQCHQFMEPNPVVRPLQAPHVSELDHGLGRIWCLTCHHGTAREQLTTLLGEQVDFEDAHLVCGSCHSNRHRDWYFGAHGKRVATWEGERTLYSCTHCHDPHEPAIKPRAPKAPPPVRIGLERDHVQEQATAPDPEQPHEQE